MINHMTESVDVGASKQCPTGTGKTAPNTSNIPGEEDGMNNLARGLFYHAYEVTLSSQTPAMIHSINGQILNFFFFFHPSQQ